MSEYALPRPVVGDAAPDIRAVDLEGNSWRLKDHLGVPTLVMFHRHIH